MGLHRALDRPSARLIRFIGQPWRLGDKRRIDVHPTGDVATMKGFVSLASIAALLMPAAAAAQLVDPQTSREIGRAVGEATVAAEQVAAEARVAAEQAIREARRGYAEGSGRRAGDGPADAAMRPDLGIETEDDAAEACALAAEDEGYAVARLASVRDFDFVRATPGGWDVQGTLETRDSWRAQRRDPWTFQCRVEGGEIVDLRLRDYLARN